MYVMVIMILYLQRYLQIGQTTFQFSNQVETYQAKDGKQFLYMALVIKMIQVMKIKLMLIHQAKVKRDTYWCFTWHV